MNKRSKYIIGSLLFSAVSAGGVIGAGMFALKAEYKNQIKMLNDLDGITAEASDVSFGFFNTTASTKLTLSPSITGLIGNSIAPNSDITINISHDLNNFTYPFKVKHVAYFDEKTSLLVNSQMGIDSESATTLVPAQFRSNHFISGNVTLYGLIDTIQVNGVLAVEPTRILVNYKADRHEADFMLSTHNLRFSDVTDGSLLEAKGLTYRSNYSTLPCNTVCKGNQSLFLVDVSVVDYHDQKTLQGSEMFFGANTAIYDDTHNFAVTASVKELTTPLTTWNDIQLKTTVENVSSIALQELKEAFQESLQSEVLAVERTSMYARFVESGLKFDVDALQARTPSGDVVLSMALDLEPDGMPNLMTNPLGLITVIEGNVNFEAPKAEFDKLLGLGTAEAIENAGLIIVSDDKSTVKTIIVAKDGVANVNGNLVSL